MRCFSTRSFTALVFSLVMIQFCPMTRRFLDRLRVGMGAGGLFVQGPRPVHRFISASINPAWQDSVNGARCRVDLRSGFSSVFFVWGPKPVQLNTTGRRPARWSRLRAWSGLKERCHPSANVLDKRVRNLSHGFPSSSEDFVFLLIRGYLGVLPTFPVGM
jgi:hypothetical protein